MGCFSIVSVILKWLLGHALGYEVPGKVNVRLQRSDGFPGLR